MTMVVEEAPAMNPQAAELGVFAQGGESLLKVHDVTVSA